MSESRMEAETEIAQAPANMSRRAASGAAYVAIAQAVKTGLTLLSTIVVARLLTPHDYGVVAMTAPVATFLQVFQSLGLNQAMVQTPVITTRQLNAMFWMNIGASAALALGLVALSPLVALFYHEPQAGYLAAATAGTVFLTGGTLQHAALLNRRLKFAVLSGIDVATYVTTFVGTAAAAYVMRNYWALWLGPFLAAGVNVALLWLADRWRPSLDCDFKGARAMVGFGANVTGFNLINFFGRNLDNVLIARVWGSLAVGLYDRAYKLMMFPLQNLSNPLGKVMIPILSRLVDEPAQYRRYFLGAMRALLTVVAPAVAVAVAAPDRLIGFLLGARWVSAAPIFFWLSLTGLVQTLTQPTGWVFISSGRGRDYVRWGVFSSVTSIAAFLVGLPWGRGGVAAAYCLSDYGLRTPFVFWWAGRTSPVRARDYYALLAPFLAGAALLWGLARLLDGRLGTLLQLVVLTLASYAICIALQLLTADGRAVAAIAARQAVKRGRALARRRG